MSKNSSSKLSSIHWWLVGCIGACVSTCITATASASLSAATSVWDSRGVLPGSSGGSTSESAEVRLGQAFGQFLDWATWVEVLVATGLAVGLATLLAYHPRGGNRRARVEALEERRTLVILGLVGAVVSSLVLIEPAMALVVFGIGGLIRFRTLLASPQLTGRAILVVVVGLAAGLGQFAMAIAVAGIGWTVIWWLHAHRFVRVRVRIGAIADRERSETLIGAALGRMHCHVKSVETNRAGRAFTFTVKVPVSVADELLSKGLAATLVSEIGPVDVDIRDE